jgi:molybdopterin synthase sulfur carrier subunit
VPLQNSRLQIFFLNYQATKATENLNEMTVKIFGQLYDIIGSNSFEVADVANSDELIKNLQSKYPALKDVKYKVAVNRNIIQSNTALTQDAEIALLPPFSGG